MMKKILYVFLAAVLALGCRKSVTSKVDSEMNESFEQTFKLGAYSSHVEHNLNIIYFVPSDMDTLPKYQTRLSKLFNWTHDFFSNEMRRNGYKKEMGLLRKFGTDTLVKIITIKAKGPKTDYPYNGGASKIQEEVNAYFTLHPTEKTSEHILVITPRYDTHADGDVGGGPFYGLGKWCFALDYEGMDIVNLGKPSGQDHFFSKWFGGMVHELGHGLNLPHNCQKVSEEKTLGMALMWAGNGTLGNSPTFLTAADAAVLNVNQIFNSGNAITYAPVKSSIKKVYAKYDATSQSIIVSGKFATEVPVTSVLYFNDPNVNNEGTGGNKDYNAVTWESKVIGTDSFYVAMPINDFKYRDASPYELKIKLVHNNGTVNETIYNYKWVNQLPVLDFSTKAELPKSDWKVASFSSEETVSEAGNAIHVIDDDASTYWHSRWNTDVATYPHQLVINTGKTVSATGLSYRHKSGLNRSVKRMEFWYGDDGVTFTKLKEYTIPNTNGYIYLDFGKKLSFKFFKVVALEANDGESFASISELGLF